jgi:hypothetical protein
MKAWFKFGGLCRQSPTQRVEVAKRHWPSGKNSRNAIVFTIIRPAFVEMGTDNARLPKETGQQRRCRQLWQGCSRPHAMIVRFGLMRPADMLSELVDEVLERLRVGDFEIAWTRQIYGLFD